MSCALPCRIQCKASGVSAHSGVPNGCCPPSPVATQAVYQKCSRMKIEADCLCSRQCPLGCHLRGSVSLVSKQRTVHPQHADLPRRARNLGLCRGCKCLREVQQRNLLPPCPTGKGQCTGRSSTERLYPARLLRRSCRGCCMPPRCCQCSKEQGCIRYCRCMRHLSEAGVRKDTLPVLLQLQVPVPQAQARQLAGDHR